MKVEGPGKTDKSAKSDRAKKKEKTGSTAFSRHLTPADGDDNPVDANTAAMGGASAVTGIDALLAAQEADDSTSGASRGKAINRGHRLLDHLDELRMGLLTGHFSRTQLKRLSDAIKEERAQIQDPDLIAVLDEVDLRAQVELAKFGRY